jgi:heme/copper-type cytochrome/quinol oxidase subunit 3
MKRQVGEARKEMLWVRGKKKNRVMEMNKETRRNRSQGKILRMKMMIISEIIMFYHAIIRYYLLLYEIGRNEIVISKQLDGYFGEFI